MESKKDEAKDEVTETPKKEIKVQEKKLLNYGYVYININPLYIY